MPDRLPDDLERLGDELAAAAGRTLSARRRRTEFWRRMATGGVVGALAFAVLTPAALDPALRDLETVAIASEPLACDQPRGTSFSMPACNARAKGAMVLHRPYAVQ
jgi:hypothetical protein